MSCFWDAIFSSINDDDYKYLYIKVYDIENNPDKVDKTKLINILDTIKRTNINDLILLLIKYNRKIQNVIWNNEELSEKLREESYSHINDFIENNGKEMNSIIQSGYLCSICDPFLLLICELLDLQIQHQYLNNTMIYNNKIKERRVLKFISDNGHFKAG